jgi:hypothetical protein
MNKSKKETNKHRTNEQTKERKKERKKKSKERKKAFLNTAHHRCQDEEEVFLDGLAYLKNVRNRW